MKFKEGERVYVHPHGWGEIGDDKSFGEGHVGIKFGSREGLYAIPNYWVSTTEYDLENGGFSQERPKPDIKEGQLIWVSDNKSKHWAYGRFLDFDIDGMVKVLFSGHSNGAYYDKYSILNPYSVSIEAQAIQVIKNFINAYKQPNIMNTGVYIIEMKEFLEEIDSYESE
jgi:hypothetical protein